MKGSSNTTATADIVDMLSLRDNPSRKRSNNAVVVNETATLLSIRQNLTYQAVMGVENISLVRKNYTHTVSSEVLASLRKQLSVEFGHLRVHRHKQVFVVAHHCLETLIAGLLRVQFHGRQIVLPSVNVRGELVDNPSVAFTWGVGMSVSEAETERLRPIGAR